MDIAGGLANLKTLLTTALIVVILWVMVIAAYRGRRNNPAETFGISVSVLIPVAILGTVVLAAGGALLYGQELMQALGFVPKTTP